MNKSWIYKLDVVYDINKYIYIMRSVIKNVLFISPLPPPFGGIASWTNKINVYGMPRGYTPVIVNTRMRGNRKLFEKTSFSFIEVLRTVVILASLLYHIVKDSPTVAHLSCSLSPIGIYRDFICALITKVFRIPLVCHYRGNIIDFPKDKLNGLGYIILQSLIRLSKGNIAENIPSLMLISNTVDSNQLKPILLPNFIEDDIFRHRVVLKESDQKRLRVVFVGGITKAKGCLEFVETAKQIKEADFIMIGSIMNDMEVALKNIPSNLVLMGKLSSHAKVIMEMCLSDLLLFPSYSEGFPNVVLEAMAVGLPIVATRVGAIPEMVEEGRGGYLVNPGDVKGIIQAIEKIIYDSKKRKSFGQYNQEKSRSNYSYSIVIKKLTDFYDSVLNLKTI